MTNLNWEWNDQLNEDLFQIREHLHQNPELSFEEYNTQKYIGSCLEKWGIPYKKLSDTGIVVDIWGEEGDGKHIALRADIDALPINEESNVPFTSKQAGIMHACGHDGHTTILLGTIYHLWKYKSKQKGLVRCIFQPGEEADGAAKKMIEAGVLNDPEIESVIALHLWPKLPLGSIGIKTGAVTAACDDFVVDIYGEGGHAARPHESIDAISIGNDVINSLKTIQTKWIDPVEPLLIHIGKIKGGTGNNSVADHLTIEGTIRSTSSKIRKQIKENFNSFIQDIVKQYGGKVDINYIEGHPPVTNDELITSVLKESTSKIIDASKIFDLGKPSMGADDFGYFSEEIPSTYFRLGIKEENKTIYDLHHPKFYFNKEVIPLGSKILMQFAIDNLK